MAALALEWGSTLTAERVVRKAPCPPMVRQPASTTDVPEREAIRPRGRAVGNQERYSRPIQDPAQIGLDRSN